MFCYADKRSCLRELKVRLNRFLQNKQCSLGALVAEGFRAFILEPPWKDNKPNESCIPVGEYECHWHRSPKYGWVYLITGIPERSHILVHPGNIPRHTRGCLLPGSSVGKLSGFPAVLNSRTTTRHLFKHLGKQPFLLEVT